jgi:transposase
VQNDTLVSIDLAKSKFDVAVSREPGRVAERHTFSATMCLRFFAQLPPATVVMEACGSAHAWARRLQRLGHTPRLLPPQHVNPYVVRDKTDRTDAKGILEAARNEEIKPVPVKTLAQHAVGGLHRLRSAWIADRTSRLNLLRGLLRELGITIPLGAEHVVPQVRLYIQDADCEVPDSIRHALAEACDEIRDFERRIKDVERQLEALAKQTPAVQTLLSVPGVGLLTATALFAFVGDVQRFSSARRFASYLGLTPRERSTGGRRRLGRISKRGDVYLRMLLVSGARSVLLGARRTKTPDRLRTWALGLAARRGHNTAAVALANKLARIVWAVWRTGKPFYSTLARA